MKACKNPDASCCSFLAEGHDSQTFLNRTSVSQKTSLHVAVASSRTDQIECLLRVKPALALCGDANKKTPLHLAVSLDDATIAAMLVPHSNVELVDIDSHSALHMAVMGETNVEPGRCFFLFHQLFPKLLMHAVCEKGTLQLLRACQEPHVSDISALELSLRTGNYFVYSPLIAEIQTDFNFCFRRSGHTPLVMLASMTTSSTQDAGAVLAKGAIDFPDRDGMSAVAAAASSDNTAVLQQLLRRFFSWKTGLRCPLAIAVFMRHEDAVDLLLQAGVSVRNLGVLNVHCPASLRTKLQAAGFKGTDSPKTGLCALRTLCVDVLRARLLCKEENIFYLAAQLPAAPGIKTLITHGVKLG